MAAFPSAFGPSYPLPEAGGFPGAPPTMFPAANGFSSWAGNGFPSSNAYGGGLRIRSSTPVAPRGYSSEVPAPMPREVPAPLPPMRDESQERYMMRQLVAAPNLDKYRQIARAPTMEEVAIRQAEEPTSPLLPSRVAVDHVVTATRESLASRKKLTPKEVILELQRGNGRFWMGLSQRPELNAMERRALIIAQAPSVAILGCSDSRVPVEIVFDQGLGDIFVVRVAGNILDAATHGSLEYAVKHLGVKVVMVLGHEGCGAVKGATTMKPEDLSREPVYLQKVLNGIKNGLDLTRIGQISDHRAREREAVVVNCTTQMRALQQNPVFRAKEEEGSLLICGAFYEITSGIVDFFSLDRNGLVENI